MVEGKARSNPRPSEGQTSTSTFCASGSLGSQPGSGQFPSSIFATMAPPSSGTSSSMPRAILQNHFHQALVNSRHPLQPHISRAILVLCHGTFLCCCKGWHKYKRAALNPESNHWVFSGSLLGDEISPELPVLAEGSLQTKSFPQNKTSYRCYYEVFNDGAKKTD